MERVGPAPDSDIHMMAGAGNVEAVTVEYEHALAGPQKKILRPGEQLSINAVVSRRWVMSAPNWGGVNSYEPRSRSAFGRGVGAMVTSRCGSSITAASMVPTRTCLW